MDPLTHVLTGAVLARTGFNRRAAYATLAMAVAAEFPDIDTLWSVAGPLRSFEHHRGITHTFAGIPFEAALITGLFYAFHRLRTRPETKAPPRWLELFAFCLLALLSHLLLDWTNNYGLRPFAPFNPHWYAGSFVFIIEPILLLLLGGALVLPALFSLINSEVGERRKRFPGRGFAMAALLGIAALWMLRFHEHTVAINMASQDQPQALRVEANPEPLNPFAWQVMVDTPDAYHLANWNTRTGVAETPEPSDTLVKPLSSVPMLAAKRSDLGRVYLDWSSWPVLSEAQDNSDPAHPLSVVTFADARFYHIHVLGRDLRKPALSGSVTLDMQAPEGQRVVEQTMDGKVQK